MTRSRRGLPMGGGWAGVRPSPLAAAWTLDIGETSTVSFKTGKTSVAAALPPSPIESATKGAGPRRLNAGRAMVRPG